LNLNRTKAVQEQKYDLEQALKKTKTNEKFYFTEMEHLRSQLDKAENELAQYKNKKGDDSGNKLAQVFYIFYFAEFNFVTNIFRHLVKRRK
jgi:alanyl-tRNA synthetase